MTEIDPLLTGIYPLRVTLTDPTTGVTEVIDFTVTILCTKSITMAFNSLSVPSQYDVGIDPLNVVPLTLPTYEPNPSTCQYGPFSYSLTYLDAASFPPFIISQNPTTTIDVATTQTTYLGTNNFQVTATDSISGLSNADVLFDINLYCQPTAMTVDMALFESYVKYTPALEGYRTVTIPSYGMVPPRCVEPYTTKLVPQFGTVDGLAPSWIEMAADERSFTVYT